MLGCSTKILGSAIVLPLVLLPLPNYANCDGGGRGAARSSLPLVL